MQLLLVAAGPPVPAAAAAALAVPAAVLQLHLLLLLGGDAGAGVCWCCCCCSSCRAMNQPPTEETKARHFFRNPLETAKHHLISCRKWREIIRNNKVPGGRNVPSEILLESYSLMSCCSCRAMNQPPRQETNSQTFFSKPTRNSKTPPNFVPKMTRNHSQEQAPRRPERPFWNPTRKLVWLLLFCYAAAAGGCWACCSYCFLLLDCCSCCSCWCIIWLLLVCHAAAAGGCWASCSCCCCCCCSCCSCCCIAAAFAAAAAVVVVMLVLASADAAAAAAPAVPWTSLQRKKPKPDIFFRNPLETAKHHLISCRKWREIIRNNKLPGGRNVPSEILLDIIES